MENTILAHKLKELRTAHGYTQDYVASALGIVRQTYSHYETGKRTPNSEAIYKLSSLYHITSDELLAFAMKQPEPTTTYPFSHEHEKNQLQEYVEYCNQPTNQQKYRLFSNLEKELLFYFSKLSETDKRELIEIAKIKNRQF